MPFARKSLLLAYSRSDPAVPAGFLYCRPWGRNEFRQLGTRCRTTPPLLLVCFRRLLSYVPDILALEMGHFHSWHAVFEGNPEPFAAIRADLEKLILLPLADLGCPIAGPDGTGVPDITDTHIHFYASATAGIQRSMVGCGVSGAVRRRDRSLRYFSAD